METKTPQSAFEEELLLLRAERKAKRAHIELKANLNVQRYEDDYNRIHNLDNQDYAICSIAGTLGGIIDTFMIGIPHPTKSGVKGGYLDGKIRAWFDKKYPPEVMERLSRTKGAKVPFDAQDNRNLHDAPNVEVDGLSTYYHRLLSLGHDPLLGFIVGVYDILNGKMTTISKTGILTSQEMKIYAEKKSYQILDAIKKVWVHLTTDVNTSMGLPVPLMSFFNTLQFGEIGKEKLSIAEVVQGMYYQGYDFQHFCAMSIPTMFIEILVRAAWWIKSTINGNPILKSTPLFIGRKRNPKLDTMLCLSHGIFCAMNAVKVGVTENPCAINYPEWCRFSELLIKEAKYQFIDKSSERLIYVSYRIISDYEQAKKRYIND